MSEEEKGSAPSDAGGVDDLKAELEKKQKAFEEIKSDMIKYKTERKELSEELDGLKSKVISDEDRELLEEIKAKREAEKEQSVKTLDDLKRLKKKELQEQAEQYQTKMTELEKSLKDKEQAIHNLTVNSAIVQAASEAGAIKPEQLVSLLSNQFSVVNNDGSLSAVVLDEFGEPKKVEGETLTVSKVVKSFLEDNPHFVRPGNTPNGSGSNGARKTVGEQKANISELAEKARYGKIDAKSTAQQLLSAARKK